jgi:hypothetical protein
MSRRRFAKEADVTQRKSTSRSAIAVEPRPGGKWAVQKDGTKRASFVTERKADAVNRARVQAQREGAELVVKNQSGAIATKDSHGRDPRRSRG